MKTKTKLVSAIYPIFALLASGTAIAADATGTLAIEATVLNACSVSTTPVVFGEVGLTSVTGNGTVIVNCTIASPFTVALDGGSSGDISNRQLTNGTGDTFGYQLYTAANNVTVWGDGTTGDTQAGIGPNDTLTVYAATTTVPSAAGAYTDFVTVTVTY